MADKRDFAKDVAAQRKRLAERPPCRQCGKDDCPRRHNLEWQEEVVSALWIFARDLQTKPITATSSDGTGVNLNSVRDALKRIMGTFHYGVIPVQ
jgi:hypothetical protein